MVKGYISLAEARASQAARLTAAARTIEDEVRAARSDGALSGEAPVFVGIGASLAAAAPAVWTLRSRGIAAYRVNPGESPLPFPAGSASVIGVSQSGKSTETLAALETVVPDRRMAVVNAAISPMAAMAAINVSLGGIPDSYASTIGYTATLMALGMIVDAWNGGTIAGAWSTAGALVRDLEDRLASRVGDLVAPLVDAHYVDCATASPSIGSAEAGSLLFREIARLPSTGFSTRQYLHGAMESAGKGTHVLMGDAREVELARMLARAGHDTIIVTSLAVDEERHLVHLTLPPSEPCVRPILEAIVMQTLAVEAALARGLDPDAFVFQHDDTKVA
ncbi:MAG: hypothetical protein P4M09_17160 [Devosia sp.]|nr:hypothetical protein [Devosia sp.]